MNNQTKSIPSPSGLSLSIGHLASIFSLLFILIIILITLFLFFTKNKYNYGFDEEELSTNGGNERKSFEFRQTKQYSSTMNSGLYPSTSSFQMDIDEQNTRSTINLLSPK